MKTRRKDEDDVAAEKNEMCCTPFALHTVLLSVWPTGFFCAATLFSKRSRLDRLMLDRSLSERAPQRRPYKYSLKNRDM